MTALIIGISVYIFSVFMMYKWIKIAFSKGGIAEFNTIGSMEIFITFCPIVNTMFFIVGWLFYPPKERAGESDKLNRFFNIKK